MKQRRRKKKFISVEIKPYKFDENLLKQQFDILGKLLTDRKLEKEKIEFIIPKRIIEEIEK